MTFTLGEHINVAPTMSDYLLDNCEAKTYALVIHLSRSKKFPELRK